MDRATHSQLALREARAMAKSRQKRKTSRIICHHLLMMLEEEVPPRAQPHAHQLELYRSSGNNKRKQYSLRF